MAIERLEYLKVESEVRTTPYGFLVMSNLEYYRTNIRNRFIVKYDVVFALDEYFEDSTLEECRDIIFNLMAGNIEDEEMISEVLTTIYMNDEKFRVFLGEKYYFDEKYKEQSLYVSIISSLVETYRAKVRLLADEGKKYHYKKVAESDGYVYMSIPDEKVKLRIPGKYREEVISYAKVWDGSTERYEPGL